MDENTQGLPEWARATVHTPESFGRAFIDEAAKGAHSEKKKKLQGEIVISPRQEAGPEGRMMDGVICFRIWDNQWICVPTTQMPDF